MCDHFLPSWAPSSSSHLDVHLDPVLVNRDDPLHGRRVGEGEQERLAIHLVHEVHVVPGDIDENILFISGVKTNILTK